MTRLVVSPVFPWTVAALGVLAALPTLGFLSELPIYLDLARGLAAGRPIPADLPMTWAIGYPLVLSPFVAAADIAGVVAMQSATYGVSIWLAWDILRRHGASALAVAAGVLLLAAHPYLLLNIQRVNESALTVPLTLLLCRWMLGPRDDGWGGAAAIGAALGFFVLLRPNAAAFLLLPLLARQRARWVAICVAAAAAVHVAGAALATGHPLYFPSNGPYNLAAGNNEFARATLLTEQNGEPSLPQALAAIGMAGARPYFVPADVYWRIATDFLAAHPLAALELVGVKAMVLFSPRLANADNLFEAGVQWMLIYPLLLWGGAALWRARAAGLTRGDRLFLAFVVLFSAPFLVTNADPRFRMPLDAACLVVGVLWIDEAVRVARRRTDTMGDRSWTSTPRPSPAS